jgi:folate-binding Fe-S cluster repair protein YgfZ
MKVDKRVDFKKGCYIAQELTARMKHKAELRKRPCGQRLGASASNRHSGHGRWNCSWPLIAASGTRGLALLRLDRLAGAKAETIPPKTCCL